MKMKIKKDHYKQLLQAAKKTKADYPDFDPDNYVRQKIGKDPALRFRWDFLWWMEKHLPENFVIHVLYEYMNDEHLDTALKNIVQEIF